MGLQKYNDSLTRFEFFRRILDEALPKTLELPKRFVELHGANLRNSVSLETLCGSKWAVTVLKRDGKAWLKNGWPDFAKHFSIECGHLLFFRYKGNSRFKVSICDSSSCQIRDFHGVQTEENFRAEANFRESRNDVSVQILESEGESEEESLSISNSPPQKRMRTIQDKSCPPVSSQSVKALKRKSGNGSKPYNPFFILRVFPSTLYPKYSFQIPSKFWKKYLAGKTDRVLFQDCDGKIWPMMIFLRKVGFPRPQFDRILWKKFVCKKNLVVGDECVLELTNIDKIFLFNITISRDNRNTRAFHSEPISGSKKCRQKYNDTPAFIEASKFRCSYPSFVGSIKDGRNYSMNVNVIFGRENFGNKNRIVTFEVGGRTWMINLVVCASGYVFSSGFSQFVKENKLLPGDACFFELISKSNVVLRVTLFRNKS